MYTQRHKGVAAELVTIGITYGNIMKSTTCHHLPPTATLPLLVSSPLCTPETSILIQKHHPYTGSLNSKTYGDSKDASLHCGDVSDYLMHIQVQNEYPVHSLSVQQHLRRDRQVIQDAEARTKGWEGVVRPTCCVAR